MSRKPMKPLVKKPEPQRPDEHFEPWEQHARVPLPVVWVALALTAWGAATLYKDRSSWELAQDERADAATAAHIPDAGEVIFLANCSTCHQRNGSGVRLAVPPLEGSEFAKAGPELVAQIVLRGVDGPIRVKDFTYDGHMPSFAASLSNGEVAEVAAYVATRFGGQEAELDAARVAELRAALQPGSWQGGDELALAVPSLPPQPAKAPDAPATLPAVVTELVFEGRGDIWACSSCHGGLGQGAESTPRLAGLSAGYLERQLQQFRDGSRLNEHMSFVAKPLTDAEIAALSKYYSGLRVASTAAPSLGGDLQRGEKLALTGDWSLGVPACFTCHGPSGFGVGGAFPALAAQQPAYVASQLAAWAGGHRDATPLGLMPKLSAALPEADRRAVADYLATLPAVPARHAIQGAQ